MTPKQAQLLRRTHALAMDAKVVVFRAQDAASALGSSFYAQPLAELHTAVERELLKARNALEAVDRICRAERMNNGADGA